MTVIWDIAVSAPMNLEVDLEALRNILYTETLGIFVGNECRFCSPLYLVPTGTPHPMTGEASWLTLPAPIIAEEITKITGPKDWWFCWRTGDEMEVGGVQLPVDLTAERPT